MAHRSFCILPHRSVSGINQRDSTVEIVIASSFSDGRVRPLANRARPFYSACRPRWGLSAPMPNPVDPAPHASSMARPCRLAAGQPNLRPPAIAARSAPPTRHSHPPFSVRPGGDVRPDTGRDDATPVDAAQTVLRAKPLADAARAPLIHTLEEMPKTAVPPPRAAPIRAISRQMPIASAWGRSRDSRAEKIKNPAKAGL